MFGSLLVCADKSFCNYGIIYRLDTFGATTVRIAGDLVASMSFYEPASRQGFCGDLKSKTTTATTTTKNVGICDNRLAVAHVRINYARVYKLDCSGRGTKSFQCRLAMTTQVHAK